jgi:hypothetical protein
MGLHSALRIATFPVAFPIDQALPCNALIRREIDSARVQISINQLLGCCDSHLRIAETRSSGVDAFFNTLPAST